MMTTMKNIKYYKEKLKVLPEIAQTELNEMLEIDTSYCDDIL